MPVPVWKAYSHAARRGGGQSRGFLSGSLPLAGRAGEGVPLSLAILWLSVIAGSNVAEITSNRLNQLRINHW
jgi:hypothetical protein